MGENKKGRVLCILIAMLIVISVFGSITNADNSKNIQSSDSFQSNEIQPLGAPLSETETFTCLDSDGFIVKVGSTYSSVWSATTGECDDGDINLTAGQKAIILLDGQYKVYLIQRAFVYFNTNSIPSGATITSATLKLFCFAKVTYNEYDVVIQNGQPTFPHEPMEPGDYSKDYYLENGGSKHSSEFSTTGFNEISLNSTGLGWISKEGVTKLCMRTSRDIDGDSPYEGNTNGIYDERILFWTRETGTYFAPKLIVTYTVQIDPPSVDTLAAGGVGMTYATLKGEILDDGGEACQVRFQIKRDGGSWWYEPDHWFGSYNTGVAFSEGVGGLSPGTKYYFKAGAKNSAGTVWDDTPRSFTTNPPNAPEVETHPATDIEYNSAKLNGKLIDNGGTSCQMGFRYREKGETDWEFTPWTDYGYYDFSEIVTNLGSGDSYEYCAGAKNSVGTTWGEIEQFITPFYFVHITDPHIVWFSQRPDRLDSVQENITSWPHKPKFVLCTGDLVEWGFLPDGEKNYVSLTQRFYMNGDYNYYLDAECEIPIYFCPGNHDSRMAYELAPPYSLIYYELFINPSTYYSKIVGDCAVFSLNSGSDCWPWGGFQWGNPLTWFPVGDIWIPEGDGIYAQDLISLMDDLDGLDGLYNGRDDSDYVKIIITHHPRVNPSADNKKDGAFWEKRSEFKQICNAFDVDLAVSGHLPSGEEFNLDGGSWSPDDGTLCMITDGVRDCYAWRNVTIQKYAARNFGTEFDIDVGDSNFLKSTLGLTIKCKVNASIYDEEGNYCGINETGGVVLEIPGACYSHYRFDNDTLGIDKTFTDASMDRDITKDYEIYINSTDETLMNFSVDVHMNNGYWSKATYENVTMFDGSRAVIHAEKSLVNYAIEIKHPDGTTDTVTPTYYEGNLRPEKPDKPSGRTSIRPKVPHKYTFVGLDGDYNDRLSYRIDWGDGQSTDWLGPYNSGESIEVKHSYLKRGDYEIRYKTKDNSGVESEFSDPLKVKVRYFLGIYGVSSNPYINSQPSSNVQSSELNVVQEFLEITGQQTTMPANR